MDYSKEFEINRRTWNKKVSIHAKSDFYDLENFKKGGLSLKKYELQALGDVSGRSVLHLQCHFGQDTLSFSRLGAKCTGIDISEEGINLARELSTELELDAQFVCCNVLDTSKFVHEQFDIVFTSYGVIGWLPELKPWAQMISERLKKGGTFYMVEFHPIAWMFDYSKLPAEIVYGYSQKEAIYEEYKGTYANSDAEIISEEYGWNHGLGELITALSEVGLKVEFLKEHDASPYNVFPGLTRTKEGLYELMSKLYPLIFEVKAIKV